MIRTAILAARTFVLAALLACVSLIASEASAKPRHHAAQRVHLAHPDCNIRFPCEGVVNSPRGEAIARKIGIGAAQKVYMPKAVSSPSFGVPRVPSPRAGAPSRVRVAALPEATLVSHPAGCPARAFCGCGAALRVFGSPVRSLWLAANWFRFPRALPAAGMVAVRRHHVFVLESHIEGATWLAYDANSGGHRTRIHARSIRGYAIVDPHAGRNVFAWRA